MVDPKASSPLTSSIFMCKTVFVWLMGLVVTGCSEPESASLETDEMIVESEVTCSTCSIVIEPVVELTDASFADFGPNPPLARDSTGRTYVVDELRRLSVYDSKGRFVRSIGELGGGPGEYERIRNIVIDREGTVHLLDPQLARHSRFTAEGEFIGSVTVPDIAGQNYGPAQFLSDGSIALIRRRLGPEESSEPLVAINGDGVGSRVPWDSWAVPDPKTSNDWLMWVSSSGEVLVGERFSFAIRVLARDLTPIGSILRRAEWIPTTVQEGRVSDGVLDKPFTPSLEGVWEDEEGVAWLYMRGPSPDWRPNRSDGRGLSQEEYIALADRPRFVSFLEAIDPRRGEVLARYTINGSLGAAFGQGFFAKNGLDAGGKPTVTVTRAVLTRATR
jgi:6-bladed beta-propeller